MKFSASLPLRLPASPPPYLSASLPLPLTPSPPHSLSASLPLRLPPSPLESAGCFRFSVLRDLIRALLHWQINLRLHSVLSQLAQQLSGLAPLCQVPFFPTPHRPLHSVVLHHPSPPYLIIFPSSLQFFLQFYTDR